MMAKKEIALAGCLRLLEPGPITLLTSQYRGQPDVMAAAWVIPASHRPPLVVAAVSQLHNTHYLISRGQEFVVNVPGRPLADQVMLCGTLSGRDVDKFARARLTALDGRRVTVPWVAECLAHLECGLVEAYEAGDHTLFLGEVIGAWADEEAFDEFWKLEAEELSPLQHLGARHFAVLGGRFEVREEEET
jgi:flavin reductase (DIM6/NTAB) family NADH-FMN oxidoreductase RutF